MSLTRHHHITNTSSSSHTGGGSGNIDALLEDLQRSVSRPGSALGNVPNGYSNSNGVVTTGFREFAKSTRTEKSGHPAETNREYQIEYLNPSNSSTTLMESKIPPNFESFRNVEHQKHVLPPEQNNLKSYKEVQKSYQYNQNNKSQSHSVPRGTDVTLKQNINELDSLLSDLNQVHRSGFETSVDHRSNGFSEPLLTSTPNRVSRVEKKTFEEQRSKRIGNSPPVKTSDFKKELVFTGSRDPSPAGRQIRDEYYYETKSSTTGRSGRDKSPPQDRVIYPPPHSNPTSPTLGRRNLSSPGPTKYYTSTTSVRERSATPPPRTGVNQKVSSYESAHSSNTTHTSRTPGGVTRHPTVKTPPPYRSPSPIAFARHHDPDVEFGGKPHDLVDFTKKPVKPEPDWYNGEPNLEKFHSAVNKFGSLDRERSPAREKSPPIPASNYSTLREKFNTPSGTLDRGPPSGVRYPPSPSFDRGPPVGDRYPPSGHSTLDRNAGDKFPPGSTLDRNAGYPGGSKYYEPESITNVEESYTTSKYDGVGNPTITHFPGGKIVEYRYKEEKTTSTKYPATITHHYPPEERQPLLPAPFPTASPTPDSGEQRPPKRVDELMASFSDSEYHTRTENYSRRTDESRQERYTGTQERYTGTQERQERYIRPTPEPTPTPQRAQPPTPRVQVQSPSQSPPPATPTPEVKNPVSEAITVSQPANGKLKDSIAGPPVYYPPGVELFPKTKEREEMTMTEMEKNGKGKMMAKRKAKYEYKAGGKSKEKSSTGKTVVPVCLPLCCAMPCSIQ